MRMLFARLARRFNWRAPQQRGADRQKAINDKLTGVIGSP